MNGIMSFLRSFNRSECTLAAILFALLFVDRAVCYSDLGEINLNGWIWFFYSLVSWVALAMAPLCGLGSISRFFYYPVVVLFIWLEAATVFVRANFKMQLDGDWVGIVMGSSPSEIKWFVGHYFGVKFVMVTIGLVVVTTLALRVVSGLGKAVRSKAKMCASLVAIAMFCSLTTVFTKPGETFSALSTIFLIKDTFGCFAHYRELANLKNHPALPEDMSIADGVDSGMTGVFVLGESATRNHWSLYGYGRKTTPCLDGLRDELIVYDDLVTPVSCTATAMELLFTTATIEDTSILSYTFAQVLSGLGYRASLYSAQERWGRWDGSETFAFAGCEPMLFVGETELKSPWYDDELLKYLEDDLPCGQKGSVKFLHLRGSHAPASSQYPPDGMPFVPEKFKHSADAGDPAKTLNHYDNSIYFTDKILGRIIARLKESRGPAWMVFLSDHGETPSSKSWRFATDRDLWEVPMVIWVSDEYKARFPDTYAALKDSVCKPLQSDQLLAGFFHIAGVRGCGVGTEFDFLSKRFKPRFPRKIEGGKSIYKFK